MLRLTWGGALEGGAGDERAPRHSRLFRPLNVGGAGAAAAPPLRPRLRRHSLPDMPSRAASGVGPRLVRLQAVLLCLALLATADLERAEAQPKRGSNVLLSRYGRALLSRYGKRSAPAFRAPAPLLDDLAGRP